MSATEDHGGAHRTMALPEEGATKALNLVGAGDGR
jgi:hypothetical protein